MGLRGGVRVALRGLGSRLKIPTTSSIGMSPSVKRSPSGSEALSTGNMGTSTAEKGASGKRGLQTALGTEMSSMLPGKIDARVAMVLSGKFTC
jgi:hypothetical protein